MESGYWSTFHRRLARRRLLRGAALGSIGVAGGWAAAACGDDDDDDPPPAGATDGSAAPGAAGEPKRGGRFQANVSVGFDTFDPHLGIAVSTFLFPRVYNVLVNQSTTMPDFVVRDLAESWEQPDEATYIFTIRPGVKMAPNTLGVPERDLDAMDAQASFTRISEEPRANASAFVKDRLASWEATSRSTFVMRTEGPYAWFFSSLGFPTATIPPRELLEGDRSILQANGVGAGPFLLRSIAEGERASLDRNPNYYGAPLPYVDGIDVAIIQDRAARRTAFLSRQIHSYLADGKAETDDLLKQADFTLAKEPAATFVSFTMNPEREPWTDGRVRRAASRAINRRQLLDVLDQGDGRIDGLVHWPTGPFALPEDELNSTLQPHDPAEARQILADAGFPDGIRIRVTYPVNQTIDGYVSILLEQFREAGITMDQDPQDFGAWLDNYRTRDYDAAIALNQIYETPETPLNWHHSNGPLGGMIYGVGIGDADIDRAIEKVHGTLDLEERIDAVHEAQRLVYSKDPAFLPFYSSFSNTLYWDFVRDPPQARGLGVTYLFLHDLWMDV